MSRAAVWMLAVGLASCAGPTAGSPGDCAALGHADALDCAEERFWLVHTERYEEREAAYDMLGEVLSTVPEGVDDEALARVHFRRGALAMELMLEHGINRTTTVVPDLREAVRLDPENPKYPPWVDAMELVLTFARGDEEGFAAVVDRIEPNVARYPAGNILSITGTMAGLPLSTGLPQRAVEMLEEWACDEEWCLHNTERAPFSQPGLAVHWADTYARVGDVEGARRYFELALTREGADRWPYRGWVEDVLTDLDGYVGRYAEVGESGSAVALVYANGPQGCTLCHGAR